MKRTISTIAAVAMLSTSIAPAFAGIVTNGGQPLLSITDIQTKIDSGEFYNYPGVIREGVNGVRIGPAGGGYIFSDKFEIGRALPQITDVNKLLASLNKKEEVTLVASNEFVIPCNPVFKELGRQNGVSCGEFMEHYVVSTTDISAENFNDYMTSVSKAALNVLGVTTAEVLIKAGVDQSAALRVALIEAKDEIASLSADKASLVAELADAMVSITELEATEVALNAEIDTLNGEIATKDARIAELITEVDDLTDTVNAGNTIFANLNQQIADKDIEIADLQTQFTTTNQALIDLQDEVINDINPRFAETTRNLAIVVAERDELRSRLSNMDTQMQRLSGQLAEAKGQVADLTEAQRNIGFTITATVENARISFRNAIDAATASANRAVQAMTTAEIVANAGPSYNNALEGGRTAQPGTVEGYSVSGTNGALSSLAAASGSPIQNNIAAVFSSTFTGQQVIAAITEAAQDAYNEGYRDGYDAGYADGFKDGFAAGSAVR